MLPEKVLEGLKAARESAAQLRTLSPLVKNAVLERFAQELVAQTPNILAANSRDVKAAVQEQLSSAFIDRLTLTRERILDIAQGVQEVAALDDPVGEMLEQRTLASGIELTRVRVPLGVVGIIFEARPNVAADCAALCFKAGNACVLKPGHTAEVSVMAIISCFEAALAAYGLLPGAVFVARGLSHNQTTELLGERDLIDVVIPRGSKRLIDAVVSQARVPVIETGAGICHVYVDKSANLEMARRIVVNAKCQRPSVCNAAETLLVHAEVAQEMLPVLAQDLQAQGVTLYGDKAAVALVHDMLPAQPLSFDTEYNDLVMNVAVVDCLEKAIAHIQTHGTHHSDVIVSEDKAAVAAFMQNVDSACVYHNASSRFTDGFEFGFGAEIGISTQKLHARGPMGLVALTTYSYHLEGHGETRGNTAASEMGTAEAQDSSYVLGVIGVGHLGHVLVDIIIKQGILTPSQLILFDHHPERLSACLREGVHLAQSEEDLARSAKTILLAVPPRAAKTALTALKPACPQKLISVVTGLETSAITAILGNNVQVVRAMPNTPLQVGRGATALAYQDHTNPELVDLAQRIFGAAGIYVHLPEEQIDAAVAVSGSTPAYFYYMAQLLIEDAQTRGFTSADARELVVQTMAGAAALLEADPQKPIWQSIDEVATKGGTTEAALNQLISNNLKLVLEKANTACVERAKNLRKTIDHDIKNG